MFYYKKATIEDLEKFGTRTFKKILMTIGT